MEPEIRAALCRLHDTGPSLALLKKHTGNRFPLPVLINALKYYKANPTAFVEAPGTEPAPSKAQAVEEGDIDALQRRVRVLEEQVRQLQAQLAQLAAAPGQ